MNLETHRLTLQPFSDDNFGFIYEMFTNEFVRTYLFDNNILDREHVKGFIQTSNKTFATIGYGLWLLRLRNTNAIIGFAGLWQFFNEDQPQLLYALLPKYTGRGFAAEASIAIVKYCFGKLGFVYLDASCDNPNIPSHKTALRIGMEKLKEDVIDGKALTFYRIEND
jgi:[ribosomal protein S5]-alanine N-acetyltransferase